MNVDALARVLLSEPMRARQSKPFRLGYNFYWSSLDAFMGVDPISYVDVVKWLLREHPVEVTETFDTVIVTRNDNWEADIRVRGHQAPDVQVNKYLIADAYDSDFLTSELLDHLFPKPPIGIPHDQVCEICREDDRVPAEMKFRVEPTRQPYFIVYGKHYVYGQVLYTCLRHGHEIYKSLDSYPPSLTIWSQND